MKMTMKTKLATVLAASMLFAGVVSAAGLHGTFEGSPIVKVTSGGQELQALDVPAINYKGRTMVPIYMLRELGATVEWDGANETVNVSLGGGSDGYTAEEIAVLWMQFYGSIADQYRDLQNYGDWLLAHAEDQKQAFLSVKAGYEVDAHVRDAKASLLEVKDIYDVYADDAFYHHDLVLENDYESDLSAVALYYADALELYEKALASLELYRQHKQEKDAEAFLATLGEARTLTEEWRAVAMNGYDVFYGYIEFYQ
ncbi:stalk domain-containing protein [Paenibacillus sp.]|uniref:stalk domain-containing protein n=1 Tax=Paenibacillus sp. TaxID=58172 RepID=UPI002D2C9F80|nr:stalk domain-containing protein [Paenibacillus sp.]HZG55911.1 stalk domain-containing protein [Paenibacillus sp.]